MASSRPFVNTPSTRIPSPTRPPRSSARNSEIYSARPNTSSPSKHLEPNLVAEYGHSHGTPSRLPRPRRQHRPSASLDISPSKPKAKQRASALVPPSPVKTQPLHIDLPAPSLLPAPIPRKFSKRDPQHILNELASLIDASDAAKMREYLPLDVMLAMHERELMEGAARLQRAKSIKGGQATMVSSSGPTGVFGIPLRQVSLYASTKAVLGGFEHDLPIVVFACVEELYRSGISTPSNPTPTSPSPNKFTRRTLSCSPRDPDPVHPRLSALLAIFDSPTHKFGILAALKDEVSDDVYALLTTFLSRLPEPVIAPLEIIQGFRDALWIWCVKPQPGSQRATSTSTRIRIAQMLLGLLPTPNLSLFVYLMAFSCQVLEVRMRRRRRESAARDSLACGTGGISALEAQLLALERELEGKNEREKEKRKLGRAWGVWLFGKDERSDSDDRPEEDSRSTQMMSWLVSHWGGIIRGFFEGGISVDPDSLPTSESESRVTAVESPKLPHALHLLSAQQQQPMTESLFASSTSLNRLRDGVSPNSTPKQPPLSSPFKMGLAIGQSYGKPTETLIIPDSGEEGSIHSRYSTVGMEVVNESQMMMKEVSQSSVSALDQRLLDLEIDIPLTQQHLSSPNSDTSSCQFQLRDETTVDLLSESISTATTTSAPAYACASDPKRTSVSAPKAPPPVTQVYSDESELAVLEYRRPLRVVNRSDSQSSSGSDSESVYSRPSLAEDEDAEGLDLVEGRLPRLTFTSSASESESDVEVGEGLPVSVQDNVFCHFEGLPNPHGISRMKRCDRCADGCPMHQYAKELEVRVAALMKENNKLRLGVHIM